MSVFLPLAIFGAILGGVGLYFASREREAGKNQSQVPQPESPRPPGLNLNDAALSPTANVPGEQDGTSGMAVPQPSNRRGVKLDPEHQLVSR
jgi:hypothetical protein